MDICHLKNAELETKHQTYKGRAVLRGAVHKETNDIQAGLLVARDMIRHVRSSARKRKGKVGYGETEA